MFKQKQGASVSILLTLKVFLILFFYGLSIFHCAHQSLLWDRREEIEIIRFLQYNRDREKSFIPFFSLSLSLSRSLSLYYFYFCQSGIRSEKERKIEKVQRLGFMIYKLNDDTKYRLHHKHQVLFCPKSLEWLLPICQWWLSLWLLLRCVY